MQPLKVNVLWSEANEHTVGGLQPVRMTPLHNGVNQLFGNFYSHVALNLVSYGVEEQVNAHLVWYRYSFPSHLDPLHCTGYKCTLESGECHSFLHSIHAHFTQTNAFVLVENSSAVSLFDKTYQTCNHIQICVLDHINY